MAPKAPTAPKRYGVLQLEDTHMYGSWEFNTKAEAMAKFADLFQYIAEYKPVFALGNTYLHVTETDMSDKVTSLILVGVPRADMQALMGRLQQQARDFEDDDA